MPYKKKYRPWNKGLKTGPLSLEVRRKLSLAHRGNKNAKGVIHTKEWKTAQSSKLKEQWSRGIRNNSHLVKENHWNWKGGISPINKRLRGTREYRLWREAVFQRDNWTCVWCFRRGVYIEADHIKPFSLYPELRFAIDNGRTLCKDCHRKTDTYFFKLANVPHNNSGKETGETPKED